MLRVLDPIEDAEIIRRALSKHRRRIYFCEDCGYPWMRGKDRPGRCANMNCRAGADIRKQNRPGRPILDD